MKTPYSLLILILLAGLSSCSKEKKTDEAALKMQEFIINISNYAEAQSPGFIIIPQNGIELAFNETDVNAGMNEALMNAVEGWGIEELFPTNATFEQDERLPMLRTVKPRVKIMVSDYLADQSYAQSVIASNQAEGFICFPRAPSNYDYMEIPAVPANENADSVTTLAQARNYLYLISTNNFATKDAMVNAIDASNYDLILIDLFFEETALTAADIDRLKSKPGGNPRLVIAYINIGAAENWRYYWQDGWKLHKPDWLKKKYDGYDDEIWVEFWEQEWQDVIYGNSTSYMQKIIDAGFDGAYLDNTEAYYFLYHE